MEHKLSFKPWSILILITLVILNLWFPTFFYLIDQKTFIFLNNNFLNNIFFQYFWGILSHKNESWINVIVMLSINIAAVFMIPKNHRKNAIKIILYCWITFQVVILTNNLIFQKLLHIHRNSPSLVIPTTIRLSKLLNNSNIKDFSNNSFPAGHALVLIYWVLFLRLYAPKSIKIISILVTIFLVLSRMVTGAHWLSDTIFSLALGWLYFSMIIWFTNKYYGLKTRIY